MNCYYYVTQNELKEQELRNERLSVRLQQRPEADDVRALQEQLSSLHIIIEQTSSQHMSETLKLQAELEAKQAEGERLQKQLEEAKEESEGKPKADDISKSVLVVTYSCKMFVHNGIHHM